eukprot:s337_g24.t1
MLPVSLLDTMFAVEGAQRNAQLHYKETCLVDSFRSLGIKVPYTQDGPFWAIADGAEMYIIHQVQAFDPSQLAAGKYVLYARHHFNGFRVFEDGTCRLQLSHKTHEGIATAFTPDSVEAAFRIVPLLPCAVEPRADFCGGACATLLAAAEREDSAERQHSFRSSGPFNSFQMYSGSSPSLSTRKKKLAIGSFDFKDTKMVELEALLLTFYWPEIQRNPALLDVVSTSKISISRRDRVKRLVRAWLLLHILSLPVPNSRHGLSPKCMPDCLFYRYVRVRQVLRTFPGKSMPKIRYIARLDVCGGAETCEPASISCVLACTGEEVCSLLVTDTCTILSLKQGQVVPLGAIWAVFGFPPPPVLHVVLRSRTNRYSLDLSNAVQQQQHDAVIEILAAGQEPDCSGLVQRTGRAEAVLLTAAAAGFFYSVHLLLSAFADPNVVGYDSRSALHLAVLRNSPMTVRLLLDCRADVHVSDFGSETPLHFAALSENVLLVKELLLAGADALAPDAANHIPLLCSREANTRAFRGDGADALVPFNYEQFAPCQDITTLAWLNPQIRDPHVRFESEKHQYFVRGMRTRGSVTGMLHLFARAFDADAVLHTMMKSDRWPRPIFVRPAMTDAVLKRVRQVDPELLLALLDVPRNDPWICRRVQSLQADFPDLPHSLSLGPQEISRTCGKRMEFPDAEIHVYERSEHVGGRARVFQHGRHSYEAGASIIHEKNQYLWDFAEEFQLEKLSPPSMRLWLHNGRSKVFEASETKFVAVLQLLWRYGWGPFKMDEWVQGFLRKFETIYTLQEESKAFTSPRRLLEACDRAFPPMLCETLRQRLQCDGFGQQMVEELVEGMVRINYGQGLDVGAFVGAVALCGFVGPLWAVKGGNHLLAEKLLKSASAKLIHAKVQEIRAADGRYSIRAHSKDKELLEDYDLVFLAAPQTDPGDIQITPAVSSQIGRSYQRVFASFYTEPPSRLGKDPAGVILSTSQEAEFNSVGEYDSTMGDDVVLWKAFSKVRVLWKEDWMAEAA